MKKFFILSLILISIAFKPVFVMGQTANVSDSLALVNLYDSTNGPGWLHNTNWLTGPVRSWYGITIDGNGRVTTMRLFANGLNGRLPHSLGNLTNLQNITLVGNSFSGGIPEEIGNLSNLLSLDFTSNQLDGVIPASLGNLSKIKRLIFYDNHLTGTIPVTLSNLDSLVNLDLSGNKLTGVIPKSFSRLKKLETLDLFRNLLSGNIPDSLGYLPNLQELGLDRNQLSGPIPATFVNLKKLNDLWLNGNKLSGTVPAAFTNMQISVPRLWHNHFTFNGMELFGQKYAGFYAPQDTILPLHYSNKKLSITAGGTISNNSYTWYKDGALFATVAGDSTITVSNPGKYWVAITNSIAKDLTLYSDTLNVDASILPVTLLKFSGQITHGEALLNWQTATEINTDYFNVQRSVDGLSFLNIEKIKATGNSTAIENYNYIDVVTGINPTPTAIFYRLQTVDKNKNTNYSKIIRLANDATSTSSLSIYPNPAHDALYVKTGAVSGPVVITITDASGKKLLMQQDSQSVSGQNITVNTSTLAAGIYILQIKHNSETETLKFIKK